MSHLLTRSKYKRPLALAHIISLNLIRSNSQVLTAVLTLQTSGTYCPCLYEPGRCCRSSPCSKEAPLQYSSLPFIFVPSFFTTSAKHSAMVSDGNYTGKDCVTWSCIVFENHPRFSTVFDRAHKRKHFTNTRLRAFIFSTENGVVVLEWLFVSSITALCVYNKQISDGYMRSLGCMVSLTSRGNNQC